MAESPGLLLTSCISAVVLSDFSSLIESNQDEIPIFYPSGHRSSNKKTNNGVVVSPALSLLSAGIGRTGCFIASSIGCQQLRETEQVDILETVCQLRLDRLVCSQRCFSCPERASAAQTFNWVGPSTPQSPLQRWHDPNHRAVPVPVLHTGPVQLSASPQRGTHFLPFTDN